ncbi:hypothetical protein i14_0830 [Escherichia coli str. 'clone D i14']|uniref:Uncharacterized protein n=1 Tax=Escherichia coli O6:H1 (strain CFT073 / ATCC 700928 / UPEC) TaxID=199310 RepID=A0A0H2V5G4_ECOL6|nr:Hypothetical protein c0864 [Escherichia coli CFT073]AER83417.1 hypothetical protein i02_0830 [Escherichia coli str. 'clone D i2']AER88336.1 hypothetical protein i14_0830 [Escherichia coli str. 'clone D i14']
MTQRDQIPGAFCRLNTGDTRSGKYVAFVVATINNHRQRLAAHGDKGFGARFTHGFRFGGDIHHVRFASGVDMGQLRHTYFFKCGWKLHGRVRASSCGAMIFSHAVRHALVEPGMAKISVLLATPATARDCNVEVPISSNDNIRNTSPKPSISRSNNGSSASGA